ncbi:MAG: high-potential iron-sulfur protein [Betaproteobacteria bacterium]|nr:high-potential iron-sulfur protein [Betaproteobacteria bacterium]
MLRDVALAAGSTALAAAVLSASANQARAAKMSQAAAGYQTAAHDGQSCANCALFQAPSSCSVVDGTVSPSGWCKLYAKKV